ncbi:hypothetical protein [Acetobacter lambici]|nr:hypothetical protein [Acetobacter lambici]MCP1243630.1 hypothetical protein [Acetobacter lambici]
MSQPQGWLRRILFLMPDTSQPFSSTDLQPISDVPSGIIVVADKDGKKTVATITEILRLRASFIPEEKIYLVGEGLKAEDIWPQQTDTQTLSREAGTLIMRQNFILALAQKMKADIYVLIRIRDEREFVSCLELAMCGHLVILGARTESCAQFMADVTSHINRQGDISTLAAFHSMIKGVVEIGSSSPIDHETSGAAQRTVYLADELRAFMA